MKFSIKNIFLSVIFTGLLVIPTISFSDEITFWHSFTQPARVAGMEKIAVEFEAQTGTTVNLEVVPWSKVREKWTVAAAAGTLPDVSTCLVDVCMEMSEAGVSRSLQPVIDLMGGPGTFASEELIQRFNFYNGNFISLPFYAHARVLMYRKDIFEEKGIATPPETWDEYLEVCKKLNSPPEQYAMIQMYDPGDWGAAIIFFLLSRSIGEAILDEDGNSALNTPGKVKVVNMMKQLYDECGGDLTLKYHGSVFDVFTSGKSAMAIDTTFMLIAIRDKRPDLYEADAVGVGKTFRGTQDGWFADAVNITVLKGDNESTADQFVAFLYEDERYLNWLHIIPGGMNPVTNSLAKDPRYFAHPHIKKFEHGIALTLEGIAKGVAPGAPFGPNPSAPTVKQSVIENMMAEIVLKDVSAEDALEKAHNNLQKLIDRSRR